MNFSVYWQHADAVSKTLYFVLLAMSIATWTIFALRIMGTRQLKQVAFARLADALSALKAKFAPLSFDQRKAVFGAGHHRFPFAVCRPVRHGMGHFPCFSCGRKKRPGWPGASGDSSRRSLDHDRLRLGGRHSGGAGLQHCGAL